MQPITLCMIIKNESKVIRRCLESVKPFISAWCIVDTGSTDGTQAIVREFMDDVPGELLEQPWTREDHNRTAAFEAARKWAPYALWIDADEVLVTDPGFEFPALDARAYEITVAYGALAYARPQVLNTKIAWRWVGRVHPYLAGDAEGAILPLKGVVTVPSSDGASWTDPNKYAKHAQLLAQDCADDPTNARTRYYLAQSYRDAVDLNAALVNYEARAKMPGWPEETWSAAFEAAKLHERLQHESDAVVNAYVKAFRMRPSRAEALYQLGRYLSRERNEFEAAVFFLRQAAALPKPNDRLFVESQVYEWRALDELSVALHYAGNQSGAIEVATALRERFIPAEERPRLHKNMEYFQGRVPA